MERIIEKQSSPACSPQGEPAAEVEILRLDWHDPRRGRTLPVKFYYPKARCGALPVILFSHGLGASREDYGYLSRYLASHGCFVAHLQHPGSDLQIWQNVPPGSVMQAMRRAAAQPENALHRVQDAGFAIDSLTRLNDAGGPLRGRLDLTRLGMAGHSFGAMTTLAMGGEIFLNSAGAEVSYFDPRIKAGIAMSSPLPKNRAHWKRAFAGIKIPCLHMTGTADVIPIGESPAEDRRAPFDCTVGQEAYLITFHGGDHMVFLGLKRNAAREAEDSAIHELIKKSSLAFWNAYLRDDSAAKEWLAGDGFSKALSTRGVFEKKITGGANSVSSE